MEISIWGLPSLFSIVYLVSLFSNANWAACPIFSFVRWYIVALGLIVSQSCIAIMCFFLVKLETATLVLIVALGLLALIWWSMFAWWCVDLFGDLISSARGLSPFSSCAIIFSACIMPCSMLYDSWLSRGGWFNFWLGLYTTTNCWFARTMSLATYCLLQQFFIEFEIWKSFGTRLSWLKALTCVQMFYSTVCASLPFVSDTFYDLCPNLLHILHLSLTTLYSTWRMTSLVVFFPSLCICIFTG